MTRIVSAAFGRDLNGKMTLLLGLVHNEMASSLCRTVFLTALSLQFPGGPRAPGAGIIGEE